MDVVSLFSILAWPGNIILAKQFLTSDTIHVGKKLYRAYVICL
jgi:hypothetical protein